MDHPTVPSLDDLIAMRDHVNNLMDQARDALRQAADELEDAARFESVRLMLIEDRDAWRARAEAAEATLNEKVAYANDLIVKRERALEDANATIHVLRTALEGMVEAFEPGSCHTIMMQEARRALAWKPTREEPKHEG